MLRPDLMATDGADDGPPRDMGAPSEEEVVDRLNVQQALDRLEELILSSPRVPLSRRTLVDEDLLIEQLDRIRLNLPSAFKEAVQIVQQRQMMLAEAERYSRELLAATDQQVAQRLDDMGIVRQAEMEAQALRQQAQQECEALRSQMAAEMEEWREAARDHWEQVRQETEANCAALKQEADVYAGQVLQTLEQQLTGMLRVVHNGQHTLNPPPASEGTGRSAAPSGDGKDAPRRRESGPRGAAAEPSRSRPRPEARPDPRSDTRSRRASG